MSAIREGPSNEWTDKILSLGKIFYDALKSASPNRVIMVEKTTGEEITSKTLLEASISLAKYLKKQGFTKDDIIGIVPSNTWKYYVVFLAGLFLGIPINAANPGYNEEEYKHCFSITQPTILFSSMNSLNVLSSYRKNNKTGIKEIVILDDKEDGEYQNLRTIFKNNTSEDVFEPEELDANEVVALIMFSSGTSGLPKAVMLTHLNLRNFMGYLKDPNFLDSNENTVTIGLLPMFHMFGTLINLSCMICQSKSIILSRFNPEDYLKTIEDYKVTTLYVVPLIMLFLAKTPLLENIDVSSVKQIICGSAPLGKELEKVVQDRFVNADIIQIYGLTETGGAATLTTKAIASKKGSAGVPVHGVTIKIVDPETEAILAFGEKGEVYIKGDGNMKGYYRNERETKKAFDGEGYLKSGDLGYFDEDGVLFIVDRLKEVIKYKGYQVSPAELEDLLKKHDGVSDAAVIGKPDERAGEVPVAYVIKKENSEVSAEKLVNYIAEHVSFYKRLHGGVIFTSELPRTSTGKLLRRVLREKLKQI